MKGKKLQSKTGNLRRLLVIVVVAGLLLSGCGKPSPKVYRVGVLSGLDFVASITDGFKEGMAELGYVEGENIVYDVQATDFDMAVYQSVLKKFVDDKVDLILAFPTEASIEAKTATQGTDIPVIFSFALIEGMGLVDSVREPGGNVTGVRYPGPDIAVKRFEILREIVPDATRIWIPYQKGYPIVEPQLAALYPVAEDAGVTLIEFPAENAAELEVELSARAQQADIGMDAIMFLAEPLTVTPDTFVVIGRFADEQRIPIGGALMVVEGHETIFGVNVVPYDTGKQAAPLADKIFKGTEVGTIPVVSAENFIQINYKATQALGLTVPESVLNQANEIIR
ncbi:MAG: ABC transporter substrate-binding protein [Anaerolineae bacterium]|nr:ABC transporter substrate-binding protein [Anaerolineae bacterium]